MPGEESSLRSNFLKLSVEEAHNLLDPDTGRIDSWISTLDALSPSSVNARMAAATHLLKDGLATQCQSGSGGQTGEDPFQKTLNKREISRFKLTVSEFKDPIVKPLTTMMLETGVRVSEICNTDVDDVDLDDLSALILGGKGEKDRTVLFTDLTAEGIQEWMVERRMRAENKSKRAASAIFNKKWT